MYGFILACIQFKGTGKNSLTHWRARIWLPVAFKKIPGTPTKCHWSRAQFQKGRPSYPLQNYICFSPLTSGL